MLNYIIAFVILAVIFALLGFAGFAETAKFLGLAITLFFVVGFFYSPSSEQVINPPR